jgi:hypothetical protein
MQVALPLRILSSPAGQRSCNIFCVCECDGMADELSDEIRAGFARRFMQSYFVGDAFRDELFNSESGEREKACAWRLQSSIMRFSALTNGSWKWRAVGIPLGLVDPAHQGDIDLLFAMRPPPMRENGRLKFPPPIHRCFELKTAKVKVSGEVKSLKRGKFHKTIGQLKKLREFGAPQVFLLEVFIVEAGYSDTADRMPEEARKAVAWKHEQISRKPFGYITLALEQMAGYSEADTGLVWPTATVQPASTQTPQSPFTELIAALDRFADENGAVGAKNVIGYCDPCRTLVTIDKLGPYRCLKCATDLI